MNVAVNTSLNLASEPACRITELEQLVDQLLQFVKSLAQYSKQPDAVLAHEALAFIRRLYQIEKAIKGKSSEIRQQRRQTDSQAVLDAFDTWRQQHLGRVAPCPKLLFTWVTSGIT